MLGPEAQFTITVKHILYKPAAEYVCDVYRVLLEEPSPQFHTALPTFQGKEGMANHTSGVPLGATVKFALGMQVVDITQTDFVRLSLQLVLLD